MNTCSFIMYSVMSVVCGHAVTTLKHTEKWCFKVVFQLSTYNLQSDRLAEWPALQKQVTSASLCEHLSLICKFHLMSHLISYLSYTMLWYQCKVTKCSCKITGVDPHSVDASAVTRAVGRTNMQVWRNLQGMPRLYRVLVKRKQPEDTPCQWTM